MRLRYAIAAAVALAAVAIGGMDPHAAVADVITAVDLNPNDPNTPLSLVYATGDGNPDRRGLLWGGRTTAVAADPSDKNSAYAVAETGGLYLSQDGGQTWQTSVDRFGKPTGFGQGLANHGLIRFEDVAVDPLLHEPAPTSCCCWSTTTTASAIHSKESGDQPTAG